jgi:hypothetical protein
MRQNFDSDSGWWPYAKLSQQTDDLRYEIRRHDIRAAKPIIELAGITILCKECHGFVSPKGVVATGNCTPKGGQTPFESEVARGLQK